MLYEMKILCRISEFLKKQIIDVIISITDAFSYLKIINVYQISYPTRYCVDATGVNFVIFNF